MTFTFVLQHADMAGGVRVVAIYARELIRRGHAVTVVSAPWPRPALRDEVRALVYRRPRPPRGGVRRSHLDGSGVPHVVIDTPRPITDADLPDADVVIATWWRSAEWVAALSPEKGAKVHFIQHYETFGGPPDQVDAVWRLPLHRVVISKWLLDLARDKFGDPDVSHVPNSVDMAQFHAPPRGKQGAPTVGLLYSTTGFKGVDVSLKAIERATAILPSLKLSAFGVGPVAPHLRLPADASYVQDPAQDRIKDLYAGCDVWLCGSRSEGFHLPPLEAMACRCPVVSTRVGGPLDTVEEGVNGYLSDVGDASGLADNLLKVLTLSDDRWRRMSDAAHATASRYTWQDACDLFEQALLRAASDALLRA